MCLAHYPPSPTSLVMIVSSSFSFWVLFCILIIFNELNMLNVRTFYGLYSRVVLQLCMRCLIFFKCIIVYTIFSGCWTFAGTLKRASFESVKTKECSFNRSPHAGNVWKFRSD